MASITKNKKGDGYKIQVCSGRDSSGKQIMHSTTWKPDPEKNKRQNEKDLQQFVADFEAKCLDGSIVSEKITLSEYGERWLKEYAEKNCEVKTVDNYRRCLKALYKKIGHIKMSELTPATVRNCIDSFSDDIYINPSNGLTGKYSPRTIRDFKTTLSSLCTSAMLDGLIQQNPCTAARQRVRKSSEIKEKTAFTVEQAAYFLDRIERPFDKISPAHTVQRNGKTVQIREYSLGTWEVTIFYKTMY